MTRKRRLTKQERLQAAWNAIPGVIEAAIVFKPFKGWVAEPMEMRWFGDKGQFLGCDYEAAIDEIEWLTL